MTPWWQGIEPVTVTARCGGGEHRVTWRRGRLVLDDHPNLEAERALAAFGAKSLCLDVLQAWGARGWDTRHVLYALQSPHNPNGQGPVLAMLAAQSPKMTFVPPAGTDATTAARIRESLARQGLQQLIGCLPPALAVRWALGAVVHHERRWGDLAPMERLDLEIGLRTLLAAAVVESAVAWHRAGLSGPPDVAVGMVGPSERPAMQARVEGRSLRAGSTSACPGWSRCGPGAGRWSMAASCSEPTATGPRWRGGNERGPARPRR